MVLRGKQSSVVRMSDQVISCPCACTCCSLWQGVPGAQGGWPGPRQAVRHEGAEEGHHHPEDKDDRTHAHRETGAGGDTGGALPHHTPLRIPDRRQAAPHPRYCTTHARMHTHTNTHTHTHTQGIGWGRVAMVYSTHGQKFGRFFDFDTEIYS